MLIWHILFSRHVTTLFRINFINQFHIFILPAGFFSKFISHIWFGWHVDSMVDCVAWRRQFFGGQSDNWLENNMKMVCNVNWFYQCQNIYQNVLSTVPTKIARSKKAWHVQMLHLFEGKRRKLFFFWHVGNEWFAAEQITMAGNWPSVYCFACRSAHAGVMWLWILRQIGWGWLKYGESKRICVTGHTHYTHSTFVTYGPYGINVCAQVCPNCGRVYAYDAQYCRHCGQKREARDVKMLPLLS